MKKEIIELALFAAAKEQSKLPKEVLDIEGLTSHKVKHFLNNIIQPGDYYVEVGTNRGATLCSACFDNDVIATGIDNFSQENIQPARKDKFINYSDDTTKSDLLDNINKFNINTDIIESDFSKIKEDQLRGKIDVFFYDGDHSLFEQVRVLKHFKPYFNDQVTVIIDDWNWPEVRDGTLLGLRNLGCKIDYRKTLTTRGEDENDFWNGLGIFCLEINS